MVFIIEVYVIIIILCGWRMPIIRTRALASRAQNPDHVIIIYCYDN